MGLVDSVLVIKVNGAGTVNGCQCKGEAKCRRREGEENGRWREREAKCRRCEGR